ncbi:alkaline phosphatase family protein [Quadrisphaera sp. DSM 44207]|uniref:alkaline phosphatase family protein n=1 Tax=Quadrisphaera sp. DSM 44207 TaxID=1881057 RepID=UPI00087FA509|nr:nucleotide pyrophosphatase/phosphodiesterase family protein [Quadrisphaera sp. DSM 44207]SDQ50385.1 Type I phosphodiesterase / nucleotide pyrophosphatase [Quadrisphaera sp. DSM 44207]
MSGPAPAPAPGGVEPSAATGSLADVLPAVAAAMGSPLRPVPFALPQAPRVCVLLVDGLGERLLAARGGHAPALRSLAPGARVLAASYPSTTATSMGSFGTGRLPGAHGLVGYQVLDPASGRLLNELSWDDGPDPRRWQPQPTVFEHLAASGVLVTRVGPAHFDGSGLTEAALRGGRYRAAASLEARVDAALAALRAASRSLAYLYWGEVDKAGHTHGWGSWQWGEELEAVDRAVRRLVEGLPADALLAVTADHGMVDVPAGARWDLAHDAELARGVRLTGGEPRAPMLYCEPGAVPDVLDTWRARLGHVLSAVPREEAVDAGWFGPVADHVLARIGDVVVAMTAPASVHDSRVQRSALAQLVGMHGALSADEVRVPLLLAAGRALDQPA